MPGTRGSRRRCCPTGAGAWESTNTCLGGPAALDVQRSQTLPLLPPSSIAPSPTYPHVSLAPLPSPTATSSLAPNPLESPLLSNLLQTMAICIIHILSTLNLLQLTLKVGDQVDTVMKDLMQQCEEMLSHKMT